MTATSLTYLIAREHINDLLVEAERERSVADTRPRPLLSSVRRRLARGITPLATVRPALARPAARPGA